MEHNRRLVTALFMLVAIMLPLLIKIPVAHAETTESGFTDYCLAGSESSDDSSSSSSSGSPSGPSVTITGIDTSLPAGQEAAKAVAKAVGGALKIDPSLIYGQMVQESGSSFNSSLASTEHNLSGIKYAGWESSLGSVGSAPSDGTGGNYTNFKDWNAYASAYASILKNHGVENASSAADFVHKLKAAGYFTDSESNYLAGVTAGAALYYGNSATGSSTASDAAQSDSGTTTGSWRRGDDSLPPETYDTTWTTSPDSSSSSSSQSSSSSDTSTASDSMTQNAKKVFDFLTNTMGFSGAGAAAVLGNFQMESGFDPTASNGTHFGLAQWSASRLAAGNITAGDSSSMTIDNELKLLQKELNSSYSSVKAKVGNATDVDSATKIWDDEFEVSGGATTATRQKYAQAWYTKFNGASISANASLLGATSTADSASSSDSSSSANSGSCSSSNSTSSGAWGWPFDSVKSIQDVFKKLDSPTSEQTFGTSPSRSGNFHDGWDFGSSKYGTGSAVKAVHDGTVYKIEQRNGYWMVDVKSSDGYYEVYQEAFASRSDIAVSEGQSIKVGDKIGTLTGSHLHLGISKTEIDKANAYWNVNNGTWLNPVREIAGQGDTTTDDYGKSVP